MNTTINSEEITNTNKEITNNCSNLPSDTIENNNEILPYHSNKSAQYGDLVLIYEGRDTYKFWNQEKYFSVALVLLNIMIFTEKHMELKYGQVLQVTKINSLDIL